MVTLLSAEKLSSRALIWITRFCYAVCLFAIIVLAGAIRRVWKEERSTSLGPLSREIPFAEPVALESDVWESFKPDQSLVDKRTQPEGRWRLAGTFYLSMTDEGPTDQRAFLEDLVSRDLVTVAEGDRLGDVLIQRIASDYVVLETPKGQETLWLAFRFRGAGIRESTPSDSAQEPLVQPLQQNRFGTQVKEYQWIMNRNALMSYYQEVLEQPDRLEVLFDSMKPLYDDEKRITGYVLNVLGEADFFSAVGLREGDVVRKVNSMPMTSRRLAESFIRQFASNMLSAVVLDIERDGRPQKLVYLIR